MLGKTQHCVFVDYQRTRLAALHKPTGCGEKDSCIGCIIEFANCDTWECTILLSSLERLEITKKKKKT